MWRSKSLNQSTAQEEVMKNFIFVITCVIVVVLTGCDVNTPSISTNVETLDATDITQTSVVLHGELNIEISDYNHVMYGMGIATSKKDLINEKGNGELYWSEIKDGKKIQVKIHDLSPGIEYYYAAWAIIKKQNKETKVFGEILTFTTLKDVEIDTTLGDYRSFSVAPNKHVYFSPGNLQYRASTNEWRFAENQIDYIGDENTHISSTYDGWVDLFGWSTTSSKFGVSPSDKAIDYSGSFVDWGINKIGNDAPNTWRTMTYDEWYYLSWRRPNFESLSGVAQVNGVNGLILLPDKWVCPDGVNFKPGSPSWSQDLDYAAYQTFTLDQWSALETSGAVFLPAAGTRLETIIFEVQYLGEYWTATPYKDSVYSFYFCSSGSGWYLMYRFCGQSVRLVKDWVE